MMYRDLLGRPFNLPDVSDKVGDNYLVEYLSGLTVDDAEELIGKTIAKVDAREYSLTLTFTDGSTLETKGSMYAEGCAMGAVYKPPKDAR